MIERSVLFVGALAVTLMLGGPVAAENVDDTGFGLADAGSFEIIEDTTTEAYCLADAGSFGLENPLSVC